ncbi:hypothetical protein ACI8AA_02605 [Geodermatophilus sp. SYSU D01180]
MTTFTIPSSAEELRVELAGIHGLLNAKKWQRAALVWAFTVPDERGIPAQERASSPWSITGFAELGFTGLSKRDTVARYRNAWQAAMDAGKAHAVEPGDTVDLPDLDWPPDTGHHRYLQPAENVGELVAAARSADVGVTKVLDITENPRAMAVALEHGSPRVVREARQALARRREAAERRLDRTMAEHGAMTREERREYEQNKPNRGHEQFSWLVGVFQDIEAQLRAAERRLDREGLLMDGKHIDVAHREGDDARMRLELILLKLRSDISTADFEGGTR